MRFLVQLLAVRCHLNPMIASNSPSEQAYFAPVSVDVDLTLS